jgi:hypothetical protein
LSAVALARPVGLVGMKTIQLIVRNPRIHSAFFFVTAR